MGTFFNALMNKQTLKPAQVDPAAMGNPVPVAYATEPPSDLSSGSAINEAAVGAWPEPIDAGYKYWTIGGWRPNKLREVSNQNVIGNYGAITSQAGYGFRWREFSGIGSSPGPIPNADRPTYNDLIPVVWGVRVSNPAVPPGVTAQKGPISIQTQASTWNGSNTASLTKTGEILL